MKKQIKYKRFMSRIILSFPMKINIIKIGFLFTDYCLPDLMSLIFEDLGDIVGAR